MDSSLYDEFGNYIGEDVDEWDEETAEIDEWIDRAPRESKVGQAQDFDSTKWTDTSSTAGSVIAGTAGKSEFDDVRSLYDSSASFKGTAASTSAYDDRSYSTAVVPHEDKKYYPDSDQVFAPDVETLIEEEDTQPLTVPIIPPIRSQKFQIFEKSLPDCTFSFEFLSRMMYTPQFIRSVCFLGSFHHGKTTFLDCLIRETHPKYRAKMHSELRYTDHRIDEQERGVSIKCVPVSLILRNSDDKSFMINILDTPGHPNFSDEVTAAIRLCAAGVVIIDALEGVTSITERILRHAITEDLELIIVINSIDRIVMELRLPPQDAYHKLRHVIEQVNGILEHLGTMYKNSPKRVSPVLGNVLFASGLYGFCFSLQSFAKIYCQNYFDTCHYNGEDPESFDPVEFRKCLWGDIYHKEDDGTFQNTPVDSDDKRTFVKFILEPLYKLFSYTVSQERDVLEPTLAELGISLNRHLYKLDSRNLLKHVFHHFFGNMSCFVDALVELCPSSMENAERKVNFTYTGSRTTRAYRDMSTLNKDGMLMVHTSKNFHSPDCTRFDVFGYVMSGTIFKGQTVRVLGESYSLDDDEDQIVREITNLWISEGRYRVEVSHVPAGNWVLIGGVDASVRKTSTIVGCKPMGDVTESDLLEAEIFRPLRFNQKSVVKLAAEPLNPSELPKMLEGLRKIDKSYPLAHTKVEESGEHVILGTGELYMDCLLHDLRKLYGDLEIKVADPAVQFCETVVESSTLKCFADTPNSKNRIYMTSEPLEMGLAEDIESNLISVAWEPKRLADALVSSYDWDILAARSIWAFGPDNQGPNILINDTLATDSDPALLNSVKEPIIQGFQWATREGPLIEESVRNCKFKIIDASISSDPIYKGSGQIIPASRRVVYSSFLLSSPRLMEPILFADIQCPADCITAVYAVLSRRRGHVARDAPNPGTPVYNVHAFLPAIEAFGFETDLRTHTNGQAFVLMMFDRWSLVPGDPLEKSIILRPLEPAPAPHLARDFLLKTRRRKGLSEDVTVDKFFDEPMLREIARQDATI